MSSLRIFGIICGLICFGISFYRLRTYAEKRTDIWFLSVFGFLIILISLFPGLMNLPAELFSLEDVKRGRLITLIFISIFLLFFFYVSDRTKTRNLIFQFDKLVRSLAVNQFIESEKNILPAGCIIILIPAFNEAANLEKVLPRIPRFIRDVPVKIILIDDGSSDETSIIASEMGALVVKSPINRGGGAALKNGYAIIRKAKPAAVVTMDADGQHMPEEIEKLVTPVIEQKADLVIGSRMIGSYAEYSRIRILGVNVFSRLINIILGTRITDCSSGFRAFNKSILENCTLVQEQYHTAELIIEAAKRGFTIEERPIHIEKRIAGTSKKGRDLKYGLYFFKSILKTWLR